MRKNAEKIDVNFRRTGTLTQLLNYFIIVGKLFLWNCRRNQIKRKIKGYQNKIANKYETERKIKKNDYFEKKNEYLALA